MKKLYRADIWHHYRVTEIEIQKETEKTVWYYSGKRPIQELKETKNHKIFECREDAERHVREYLLSQIKNAENVANIWRYKLDKFNQGIPELLKYTYTNTILKAVEENSIPTKTDQ